MRPNVSFVEQPVRSLQTMLRVLSIDDNSKPTVIPDGIYGPSTMQAVTAFQRSKGIPATGITDQQTWDFIVKDYELALIRIEKAQPIEVLLEPGQIFRRGDSSPYIYLLQSMLTQLSNTNTMIPSPNHNGVLDDDTAASLIEFQRLSALPKTGEFDKITWKHLVHQFTLSAHISNIQRDHNKMDIF
jgi:peptidoglycan hydrolase-like protein with peptidoglycan-binding domain